MKKAKPKYEKPRIIYNAKLTIRACSVIGGKFGPPTIPGQPGCG